MKKMISTLTLLIAGVILYAGSQQSQLQLQILSAYGTGDRTSIYFGAGLSQTYASAQDEQKIFNNISGYPNLYSLTSDNVKCELNGYGSLTESAVIALGVLIDSSVDYSISLTQMSNFDSSTLFILEDRKLNIFTPLRVNFYQVALTPDDTMGRFFLHVTKPVQATTQVSGCTNNTGSIILNTDSVFAWNQIYLYDSNFNLVNEADNVSGQFAFTGLAEGHYNLRFNYGFYSCGEQVYEPGNHIITNISASSYIISPLQEVNFSSFAINATQYVWQFGDSSVITGEQNPSYFYYYPGAYTVTLTCSNEAGCTANASLVINVSQATGINTPAATGNVNVINLNSKTIQVQINNPQFVTGAELDVYNILGQQIYQEPVTDNNMTVSFSEQPSGVYLVTLRHGQKSSTTKVYIN